MHRPVFSTSLLGQSIFCLSFCALNCGFLLDEVEAMSALHAFAGGDYAGAFTTVEAGLQDKHCSDATEALRQRVSLGLGQHHAALEQLEDSSPRRNGVVFGPSVLVPDEVRVSPEEMPFDDNGRYLPSGWFSSAQAIDRAENTKALQDWQNVRDRSAFIFHLDVLRAAGKNFDYTPSFFVQLQKSALTVRACDDDIQCLDIDTSDLLAHPGLADPAPLRWFLRAIGGHGTPESRRNRINILRQVIDTELKKADIKQSPAVRRETVDRLLVSIDPGDYRNSCREMSDIVERFWSGPDLRVTLRCLEASEDASQAYRIESSRGSAHYVHHAEKAIFLGPFVQPREFAHEVGHLLGLPDSYIDFWDPKKCEYRTYFDNKDLMSNAYTGHVTDQTWTLLRERYPI